jgi:hypothetical protein
VVLASTHPQPLLDPPLPPCAAPPSLPASAAPPPPLLDPEPPPEDEAAPELPPDPPELEPELEVEPPPPITAPSGLSAPASALGSDTFVPYSNAPRSPAAARGTADSGSTYSQTGVSGKLPADPSATPLPIAGDVDCK